MSLKSISLKSNFQLLNPEFEGYKLQAKEFQNNSCRQIENGIFTNPTQKNIDYLYARLDSLHNYIFHDPFDAYHIYLFNSKGCLLFYKYQEQCLTSGCIVSQVVLEQSDSTIERALPPSVDFPSTSLAVISNGVGNLIVAQTGDRNNGEPWNIGFQMPVKPGIISQSVFTEDSSSSQSLHILFLTITTPKELTDDSSNCVSEIFNRTNVSSLHVLYWFVVEFDGENWKLIRERRIAGYKSLCFVTLSLQKDHLILLAQDNFEFIYDSVTPVIKPMLSTKQDAESKPKYIFKQSEDEVSLYCHLGKGSQKQNILVNIEPRSIEIKHKGDIIVNFRLLHSVEKCACTWSLEDDKLEINMPKVEEGITWKSLFEDDTEQVEEILDQSLVDEAHQRLAHLTSDEWETETLSDRPAFNPGQLEACDDSTEELNIMIFDGNSHAMTHLEQLGSVQHLFNVQGSGDLPFFCLRNDVDGLLWSLKDNFSLEHTATFNAFGYVKASKTMEKFTQASPDHSYVAVADLNSRVYVFCQPEELYSELRNRKSGKRTNSVARQLVISLKNHDQVMGFHCAPKVIFVLTKNELCAYALFES